jgi:hypothetical protein
MRTPGIHWVLCSERGGTSTDQETPGDGLLGRQGYPAVLQVVPGTRLDRNTAARGMQLRSVSRSGWSCSRSLPRWPAHRDTDTRAKLASRLDSRG